ncbi:hypothetical protein [Porcipelethomonas sp.]|uniref:hypothetical protein n=1 Tax=Porcipelethomonas sp. TaxID=2981675 RepID=UPI003EF92C6C
MKSNRAIIKKAAADTSALGTGGRMNAEQATQFMTFMQDYSPFLKKTNFIRMTKTTRDLDSLEVNKRALRRQVENDDNPATGTVSHKRRSLKAVGVVMPYDVSFQYMKENIEGENINTTLAKMFAQQFANDTVELAFLGDESSDDDFISINDGWIKIAKNDSDTHKFDTEGSTDYLNTVFPGLLNAMPDKYYNLYTEEDKSKIKIFCSPTVNRKYKQQLQARNTALGDALITGGKNVSYDGFEIVPVAFIPNDVQIVTPYENLVYGIYGQSLEVYNQVVPRKTRYEYTLLADFDMEINNPDALVIGDNFT